MVVSLFGQPASGKTTRADLLVPYMPRFAMRIDGDVWREITENKDYSEEGRRRNLKSAYDMAIYLERNGISSLMSFVSPFEDLRQYLSSKTNCVQIYLEYNEDRGRNNYFAKGFDEPKDCLRINTSELSIDECLIKIREYIKQKTNYESELD
jgi:adenylylsulfate kinase-like enzyme